MSRWSYIRKEKKTSRDICKYRLNPLKYNYVKKYAFEGYGKGNWILYSPRVYITDELGNDTEIYVGSSDGNTSLAEHTYDVSNLSGKYAIKISCHAHPYWGNAQGWARLTTAVLL